MSFIYLQEIWLQTLFYLNFLVFFNSFKKIIFTKEKWIVHMMCDCGSVEVSGKDYICPQ